MAINPFSLIEEHLANEDNGNKYLKIGLCEKCKHVMIRKCHDGAIGSFIIVECSLSQFIDIEKFMVVECTQFSQLVETSHEDGTVGQ